MESLEITDFSLKNGGARNKIIIPELESIASKNINFSNSELLGGFRDTSYTAAAIFAQTAGIPLKFYSARANDTYDKYNYAFKSIFTIGTVLEKNGYRNYYLMGSEKEFADRGNYLEQHGNYEIFDFNTAKELEYIPQDYNINWWGFEDKKLYEYAKEKLSEISKNDAPFNFNLLTVDTHPIGGYLDEDCKVNSDLTKYENVYACASSMLNNFINWLKKQSFYKDTTIIIVGDHLNMTKEDLYKNISDDYERKVYNAIINSSAKSDCYNNRIFTAYDMYPTTLAALGATIEGERLGLGTNLFSCKETLAEELGLDNMNNELSKKSEFYNNCLYYGRC